MVQQTKSFIPDKSQQEVIEAEGGYHLVLAPPGCGKTQILTERIIRAHLEGIAYADMLCLTFTNRAARGMRDRIAGTIADEGVKDVYVGNIHRFCSKFLFEQGLMSPETSVIDDDDTLSILAHFTGVDELALPNNGRLRQDYFRIAQLSHLLHQVLSGTPKHLRLHPDSLSPDDVKALRYICQTLGKTFTPETLTDIYHHAETWQETLNDDIFNVPFKNALTMAVQRLQLARQYELYKEENFLLDFEDLLILTYDHLSAAPTGKYPQYSWIQVDEVQDLNPLQIKIIDLFTSTGTSFIKASELPMRTTIADGRPAVLHHTATSRPTVMYLGDEQQAIFSFMGARLDTLDALKGRCEGHIHHLERNHRSPKYLLDVFNTYAHDVLKVDWSLLPTAGQASAEPTARPEKEEAAPQGSLQIRHSATLETEYTDAADTVEALQKQNPQDTTAVVVSANHDAEEVSQALNNIGVSHFKVSGNDLFATEEVKLLFAHLNVLANEHNFISWTRLLKGLHVFKTNGACRNFVQSMTRRAMLPTDLLLYDGSCYVQEFVQCYEEEEIVVFDTETTGLSVFEDDIIQIAAVKIRRGSIVPGSELSLFIETERPIPEKLGDIVNPIIEERKHHALIKPAEALRKFLDYAGHDTLLGHNVEYDYHILDFNLRRYLPSENFQKAHPRYFDSLKLIRLLHPELHSFKLKNLLEVLRLSGENSHLADEDVNATRSLVNYCYEAAKAIAPQQYEFLQRKRVIDRAQAFRQLYLSPYLQGRDFLYQRLKATDAPALVEELKRFYETLQQQSVIAPIKKFGYILRYLAADIIDTAAEPSLYEQLQGHIVEIDTLKEADLCGSSSIADRIFVTTVHKAKGLEFDNVIVFDAIDGRYPNYYNQNNPKMVAEDARKFYVAMSRAKKRLIVYQSDTRLDAYGYPQPRSLTRFMQPILMFFEE